MKYLFAAIDARAGRVKPIGTKGAGRPKYNPIQLKKLIVDASEGLDEKTNSHDFVDTLERIVNEIKNTTEHSGPFLQKVRKSDVPDYYDVIKKPMDLATLLKRVKSQQYRTKKAFAEDLDQIWTNALLYNSYPDHPIRRSAEFLRQKSNQLLEFISDPSLPTRSILASAVNESVARSKAGTPAAGEDDDEEGDSDEDDSHHRIGRSRLGSFVNGRGRDSVSPHPDAVNGRHRRESRSPSPVAELAFEERPAIIRTAQAMADFDQFDAELSKLDDELDFASCSSSSRLAPFDPPPPPPATNGIVSAPAAELAPPTALPSRLTLLMRALQPAPPPSPTPFTTPGSTPAPSAPAEPPAQEPDDEDERPDSLWWKTVGNPAGGHGTPDGAFVGALGAGLPLVPFVSCRSEHPPTLPSKVKGKAKLVEPVEKVVEEPKVATRATRGKKAAPAPKSKAKVNGVVKAAPKPKKKTKKLSPGIAGIMFDNWKTFQRVKQLHTRTGRELSTAATLDVDSDDDLAVEDQPPIKRVAYLAPRVPRPLMDSHLAAKLNQRSMEVVSHRTLSHAGFDGASAMALDVLTHVASEYIQNVGKTLKLYMDRSGDKLSSEHILLHALGEHGVPRPGVLREWVDEQKERGVELKAIERKLEKRRGDRLDAVVGEKVDGEEALLGGEAQALADGSLGAKLGEDFFGLIQAGLDRELGTSSLSIPSHLFRGEAGPSPSTLDSAPTTFTPPPPFVPLTPENLSAQIGLLQPYFHLRQQQPVPLSEQGETLGLTEDVDVLAAQVSALQGDGAAGLEPKGKVPTRAKVPVGSGRIPVKVKREEKEGGSKKKRKKDLGEDMPAPVAGE